MSRSILYIIAGAIGGILIGFIINLSGFILFTNIGLSFGLIDGMLSLIIVAGSIGAFIGLFIRELVAPSGGNKFIPLIVALIISAVYGAYFVTVLHPRDLKSESYFNNLITFEEDSIQRDRDNLEKLNKCILDAKNKADKDTCYLLYDSGSK